LAEVEIAFSARQAREDEEKVAALPDLELAPEAGGGERDRRTASGSPAGKHDQIGGEEGRGTDGGNSPSPGCSGQRQPQQAGCADNHQQSELRRELFSEPRAREARGAVTDCLGGGSGWFWPHGGPVQDAASHDGIQQGWTENTSQ